MATSGDSHDESSRVRGDPFGTLVLDAPKALRGHRHTLFAPGAALGRTGDVRLDSPSVSRVHAQIWTDDGRVWIADDGSVNGTFLNGRRLTAGAEPLDNGDQIRLGEVCATFHSGLEWPQDPTSRHGESRDRGRPTCAPRPSPPSTPGPRPPGTCARPCTSTVTTGGKCSTRRSGRSTAPSAPSPGVDLSVLARHALVADRRALVRDAALAVVLLVLVAAIAAAAVSADAVDLVERQSLEGVQGEAAKVCPWSWSCCSSPGAS